MTSDPRIADEDVVLHHFWCGMGKGSRYQLEHLPSGISVSADCQNSDNQTDVVKELAVALEAKLRNLGMLAVDK